MLATLRKAAAWGVVAFCALVAVLFARPMYRQGEPSVAGKTAQDFAIQLDGKPAHLSDLRGKVVVLNFWGSWCGPCIEELPSLIALQQRISSRNALVLGVAADPDPVQFSQFLREHRVNFPTYRDPGTNEDRHSPIAADYGTSMYPETYVINRKGRIARKIIGPQDWNSPEMTAYFDAILAAN